MVSLLVAGYPTDSPRPYLTIRDRAVLLALSMRTIHRYIAHGKLKGYRVDGEALPGTDGPQSGAITWRRV